MNRWRREAHDTREVELGVDGLDERVVRIVGGHVEARDGLPLIVMLLVWSSSATGDTA
jgi:hypothetical protein